jgi:hypothetical protein
MGLALTLAVFAVASACTGSESASTTVSPSAGELAGIRIDVHETPD